MTGARVAVVGCGRWGRRVVEDLRSLGANVVTVDPDTATAAELRSIEALGSTASVDAFVVATPASTHADVLRSLATFDVPVFCEKPLTSSLVDAEEAVALLGDRLHVMHVWRYHPGVELLGELARGGSLGAVHGLRTVRDGWTSPRTDVDAVWTLLPHDLTLAIEILGSIPTPRAAVAELLDGRAVSMWAHLGGRGEPFAAIEASTRFGDKRREVRVHGSEAVAVLRHADASEVTIERGTGPEPIIERIPFMADPPLRRELVAFLDHVAGGAPPKSSGDEGLAVVRAVADLRALAGLEP